MKIFGLILLLAWSGIGSLRGDSEVAAAQEILKARGLYHGAINGEENNETAAALTRFQVRNGIEVTGQLNEETLRSLGLEAPPPGKRDANGRSRPRAEAWRALREQDRKFLEEMISTEPIAEARELIVAAAQIRDFVAGFVVAGISEDVEAELQFYAEKADYYDNGLVSKDFIRRDILRYNQRWPIRRYWLNGDIYIVNERDPIKVRYQIKYSVRNQQDERTGTAVKTLELRKAGDSLEIVSVREKTLN